MSETATAQPSAATPEVVLPQVTAPVVQKTPELSTTEPLTPQDQLDEKPAAKAADSADTSKADAATSDPEKEKNEAARLKLQKMVQDGVNAAKAREANPPKADTLTPPDINNYKTLEEYNAAVTEYGKGLGLAEAKNTASAEETAKQNAIIRSNVATREAASVAKHPDYMAVVAPLQPLFGAIPLLRAFIAESDMGTEVMYHLSKNPAVLDQLMDMTPFAAGRRLIELESKLKAPTVQQSSAPDPIKPVGSRETVRPNLATLAEKDTNGYIAKRNKQELAKLRGTA